MLLVFLILRELTYGIIRSEYVDLPQLFGHSIFFLLYLKELWEGIRRFCVHVLLFLVVFPLLWEKIVSLVGDQLIRFKMYIVLW